MQILLVNISVKTLTKDGYETFDVHFFLYVEAKRGYRKVYSTKKQNDQHQTLNKGDN